MIKIRYSDLPPGLHASAKAEGRHTVIYLVPGLSAADRRSAIARLRSSAKFGYGPRLPAIPLAIALVTERIRLNTRNAAAAARLHPAGVALPVAALTGGAILYALLVTVSIRIGLPATSDLALGPLPVATFHHSTGGAQPVRGSHHTAGPAAVPGLPGQHRAGASRQAGGSGGSAGTGAPGRQQRGSSPDPSSGPTPSPQPGGGSPPTATPSPGSSSSPSPDTVTLPRPSPSPSQSKGSGGGTCVQLSLIHVCL